MFEKLLEQLKEKVEPLKEKLPFISRGKETDDDEEDEDDDFDEVTSTREFDPSALDEDDLDLDEDDEDEDDEDDEDDDDEEGDDEGAAKAKKKKLLHILLIAAIGYLALDEFVLKEDPPAPVVKKVTKKAKPKKRKKRVKKKVEEKAVKEQIEKKEAIEEKPTVVQKTREDNNVIDSSMAKDEPKIDTNNEQENNDINQENFGGSGELNDNTDPEPMAKGDALDQQLNKIMEKVEENKEELVEEVKYTKPPTYEDFGQALVYNCKGKHWACVDKASYFSCLNNEKWAQQNSEKKECATSKILASPKDCRTLQLYNINMVAEVPDCGE